MPTFSDCAAGQSDASVVSVRARMNSVSTLLSSVPGLALALSVTVHAGLVAVVAERVNRTVTIHPLREREPIIEVATTEMQAPDREREERVAANGEAAPIRGAPAVAVPAATPVIKRAEPAAPAQGAIADGAQVTVAAPTPPVFVMRASVVSGEGSAHSNALAAQSDSVGQPNAAVVGRAGPLPEGAVDTPAKLIAGAPPMYTSAAEAAGVEAEVPLELIISRSGFVDSARALVHIGYGLDEAALAAVRGYRFKSAQRLGQTVAVRMRWVMRFQLR
jgi:TonB family protein